MDEQTNQPPTCHPTGKWIVASNGKAFCSVCGRELNQPIKPAVVPAQVPVTEATVSQTETPMLQLQPEKVLNAETVQATEAPAAQTGGAEQSSASRDPLLVERETSHGDFRHNAEDWDSLHKAVCLDTMHVSQRLAVNQMFLKLARAIQHPYVKEHWDDIAGYAKLAAEVCTK